jgi:L-alanine-DL-glutamate epimerase-like enolase superfamily enzyme
LEDFADRLGPSLTAISWVEEPFLASDLSELQSARRALPVELAAGETLIGRLALERMLELEAVGRVTLNPVRSGGAASMRALGSIASSRGIAVASHVHPHVSSHLIESTWPEPLVEYLPWWDHYFDPGAYSIGAGCIVTSDTCRGFGFDDSLRARLDAGGERADT